MDNWGIAARLRNSFGSKGFIVITDPAPVPEEVRRDPCLVLSCFVEHTTVTSGTNAVTIILKNCNNTVVYTGRGTAMGMSLQDDYNKGTKRAYANIDDMSYSFNPSKTPQLNLPAVEQTHESEESIEAYLTTSELDPIEGIYKGYQSEALPYYKFGIVRRGAQYKAIIIESEPIAWKPGEVKAIFEPSAMRDLYSVKWFSADKTSSESFGTMESNSILTIELVDRITGQKRQEKFIKMFPASSSDVRGGGSGTSKSGSGFFMNTDGLIATNAHVVEQANRIQVTVVNPLGTFVYNAKVVLADDKNDVALIQIQDEKFKGLVSIPYGFTESAEVGTKVFTIGYPLNSVMGSNYKLTDGIVSSRTGIGDDVRYYQITVPLQPGNSGGPLFDDEGNIIGITSARLNAGAVGTSVENVNYAIKTTYLSGLYGMLPDSRPLGKLDGLKGRSLQDQVKVLKDYVCLIKVY